MSFRWEADMKAPSPDRQDTPINRRGHGIHGMIRQAFPDPVTSRRIRILLYGSNIWFFGEGMLGPIFAVFTAKVGGNILDVSWIWAMYLLVTGVFTIIVGKISDQYVSKEKLMVSGYALNTVFTFAYLLVDSPATLLLVQAGLGVAAALATPTWDALYSDHEHGSTAGYLWGLAGGQAQFLTGIAVLLGGLILTYFSWTVLFVIMGTIQTIATIYQAQILRNEPM
jgi:MFS family permease